MTTRRRKSGPMAKPNPRAAKAKALLDLALDLEQDSMNYPEIEARYRVAPATARRMVRDLKDLFPSAMRQESDTGTYARFSMALGAVARFSSFGADEYVLLREAGRRLEAEGRAEEARRINAIAQKVLGMLDRGRRNRVEVDATALAEHERIAARPGPRPSIDPDRLREIRNAILATRVIEIEYERRINAVRGEEVKTYRLEPHGLLFGTRHYLVGFPAGRDVARPATFALANIRSLRQTQSSFSFRPGFDIDRFAQESFGIWHGDEIDVAWTFAATRRRDVLETHFHTSQQKLELPDGRIVVTFRAAGQEEMLHHMFTWKTDLIHVEPPELRARYREWLTAIQRGLDAMEV